MEVLFAKFVLKRKEAPLLVVMLLPPYDGFGNEVFLKLLLLLLLPLLLLLLVLFVASFIFLKSLTSIITKINENNTTLI